MIYGVFHSEGYCEEDIIGYFNEREDADKYIYLCKCKNGGYYSLKPIENLLEENDLQDFVLKYTHVIYFNENDDGWNMSRNSDEYSCYMNDELKCNNIQLCYNDQVAFYINTDGYNRALAEKIAQDYFVELMSYGDGEICQRNIDLMNEKFEAPFKERAGIKREEETKQKELAELARLKEKYESN